MNIIDAINILKSDVNSNRIDSIDNDNLVFTAYKVGSIIRIDIK